ncbi:MAG: ATP-binding protein [Candidatus Binatia bacterium]
MNAGGPRLRTKMPKWQKKRRGSVQRVHEARSAPHPHTLEHSENLSLDSLSNEPTTKNGESLPVVDYLQHHFPFFSRNDDEAEHSSSSIIPTLPPTHNGEQQPPHAVHSRHIQRRKGRSVEREQINVALRAEIAERKRAEEALRKAYAELEQRVQERTVDIQRANAALREEIRERQRAEEALRALNETLEHRVEKRTTALARANKALRMEIFERQQTEAALEEVRRQNEMILNSAGEGIFGLDMDGKATFVNPAAARMLGYEVSELLGKFLHDILHYQKADGTPYPATACPLLRTLHGGIVTHVTEEVYWRKDGTSFPVDYINTPIHDEKNRVIGAVVTFQDITQRKEIEQTKNEVLSMVSHEIRTPLSSLRGFTELMLNRNFSPEKQRELLTVIHNESLRLSHLLDDFLDLQQIEEGKHRYTFAPISLAPLCHEVTSVFANHEGKHSLHLDVAPILPPVHADAARLRQVLSNLLSNAIKFSPQGGKIIVGARQEDQQIIIWVKDHGVGIPPEALPQLFSKFFRVDNSDIRNIGGTGLGLALVREIITAHRGKAWVESSLGVGSTFFFSLPIAVA